MIGWVTDKEVRGGLRGKDREMGVWTWTLMAVKDPPRRHKTTVLRMLLRQSVYDDRTNAEAHERSEQVRGEPFTNNVSNASRRQPANKQLRTLALRRTNQCIVFYASVFITHCISLYIVSWPDCRCKTGVRFSFFDS